MNFREVSQSQERFLEFFYGRLNTEISDARKLENLAPRKKSSQGGNRQCVHTFWKVFPIRTNGQTNIVMYISSALPKDT